jgi:NAD(P)H dehydrogenase (quinone)
MGYSQEKAMKVLVVYTHPNPKSFNHAILDEVEEGLKESGHEVKVKDLYALNFKTSLDGADFVQIMDGKIPPDVVQEQADIAWADGLVFIYPIWWFSTPALLKGWVDRVLLKGFAYDFLPEGPKGLLKHQKALVLTTTGGPEAGYDARDAKGIIIRPMTDGTLGFCGVQNISHKNFYGLPADEETRKGWLVEVRALAKAF